MTLIPSFGQLTWPILNAIKALGGKGNLLDILGLLVEGGFIPAVELDVIEEGEGPPLSHRLYLALTYLEKGDAITAAEENVWSLTDCGNNFTEADMPGLIDDVRLGGRLFIQSLHDGENYPAVSTFGDFGAAGKN